MNLRAREWLFGAALGVASLWLAAWTPLGLVLVAVVAIPTVFPRRNPAYAGGLLLGAAALALYEDAQLTARCAAANGPNGSCVVIADPSLPVMVLAIVVGVLLSAAALVPRRAT